MASTTAPAGPFRGGAGGTTPPWRHLWQVPTFLVGLAALAAVCAARPLWHEPRSCGEPPALASLRELLKQPDFDGDPALKLGAEAVQDARTPSARAAAHFLLGSVYVALAERAGPPEAKDQWREARTHLEQARALAVSEDDRPRLDYRLAKAWAHTGEPPQKVIAALRGLIEDGADDPHDAARGYELLADAYLKLPKPDLEAALDATVKEIDLPTVDAVLLAPARLRRGELLLRLDRAEEGREVLRNIKAPPAVVARARRRLVGSLEQDGLWGDAAGVLRDVRDDKQVPPQDPEAVLYHLGLCLRRDGTHKDEALQAWGECLAADRAGDEGPAAALGVADLRLRGGQVAEAVTAFERAVRDVKGPGDWHNALVPLPQAREALEAGCKAARAAGAFEPSARLAQLYERLAPPGRAQELRAEAIDALARATLDRARLAAGDPARQLYGEAEALLRQAGEAHEQSANAQSDPAEQAERLWPAANDFLDGHDAARAAAAFDRFLKIAHPQDRPPDRRFIARLNEAWYKLALARRGADDPGGAAAAFEQAVKRLESSSRYIYRARYELAMSKKKPDGTWTDDAQAYLEQNLSQLGIANAEARDAEAREKTLFALGDLYFERREQRGLIPKAINTLEDALRDFPNNADALYARYELAESYRLRAEQVSASLNPEQLTTEARLVVEKRVMEDREKAVANYQELSRQLEAKQPRTKYEENLLVCALRMAAEVRYWAGGYERSAEMFEALAGRLKDQKGVEYEYFYALVNVVRGYSIAMTTYAATEPDHDAKVQLGRQKVKQSERAMRAVLPAVLPLLNPKDRKAWAEWLNGGESR